MCLVKTTFNCISKLNGIQKISKDAQVLYKQIFRQISTQNGLKKSDG